MFEHEALSCAQMEVYGPTTQQPAGTNYQHVYDGLQAVENAPAPNFPVSEPLSCASLSMDPVMLFVSCLLGVVTCWVEAARSSLLLF